MQSPNRRRTRSPSLSSEDDDDHVADETMIPLYNSHSKTIPENVTGNRSKSKAKSRRKIYVAASGASALVVVLGLAYSSTRHVPSAGRPRPTFDFSPPSPMDVNRFNFVKSSEALWNARAQRVKDAFVHAYDAYEQYAFPMDEVRPLSKVGKDNFNSWGVTAVDSIDTMLLMNLTEQYERARAHVQNLDIMKWNGYVGIFETVIRHLGSYLSAYAMTGDDLYKHRADELGQFFLPAFETKSGAPVSGVYNYNGTIKINGQHTVPIAEMGTLQMEYKYLAHITGNPVYFEKAEKVNDLLAANVHPVRKMIIEMFSVDSGRSVGDHFSVGAGADSAYEYFLKQYLLTAKTEAKMLDLYLKTMQGLIENLVYLSPKRNLMYVTDTKKNVPTGYMEHLACFFPGLLTLGTITLPLSPSEKDLHLAVAQGLTETCYLTYVDQISGVGAEGVRFDAKEGRLWIEEYKNWVAAGGKGKGGYPPGVAGGDLVVVKDEKERGYVDAPAGYELRPEVIESVFLMYRATGNEIWRERGWKMFEAIDKSCRGEVGFSSIKDIDSTSPKLLDGMPSFFLAETLKYFYLLFQTDPSLISLDQWVFNTEAHPLPVFRWSSAEVRRFEIQLQTEHPSP